MPRLPLVSRLLPITSALMSFAVCAAFAAQNSEDDTLFQPIAVETPEPITTRVTGIVVDELDQPIANAPVIAAAGLNSDAKRLTAYTNDEGRFNFEKLEPEGLWYVYGDDPRYAAEWVYECGIRVPDAASKLDLRIRLYLPRQFTGRVVNNRGEPVAGVSVILNGDYLPESGRGSKIDRTHVLKIAETDAGGNFTIPRRRPGEIELVFEHPDYAGTWPGYLPVANFALIEIQDGVTLKGRAVAGGEGVEGVQLNIGTTQFDKRAAGTWEVTTGAEGEFTIEHVPDVRLFSKTLDVGAVHIVVDDPQWVSPNVSVYANERGELPEVTLELIAAETIDEKRRAEIAREWIHVGNVVPLRQAAKPKPTPAPESVGTIVVRLGDLPLDEEWMKSRPRVEAMRNPGTNDHKFYRADFDAEGSARVENCEPGQYRITYSGQGGTMYLATRAEVSAGGTTEVVLRKGSSRAVGRIMTTAELKGFAYLSFVIYGPDGRTILESGRAKVFPDASYAIEGLIPGEYSVQFGADSCISHTEVIQIGEGENKIDIVPVKSRIEGKLIGIDYPLPKNKKSPDHFETLDRPRIHLRRVLRDEEEGLFVRGFMGAHADKGGHFVIHHVPPGDYLVYFEAPEANLRAMARLTVEPGVEVHPVELKRPENLGEIAGRITAIEPNLKSRADWILIQAHLMGDVESPFIYYSEGLYRNGTGEYRIVNVPEGIYGVLVYATNQSIGPEWIPNIEVRAGMSRNQDIEIAKGREIELQFEPPSGDTKESTWRLLDCEGNRIPDSWKPTGLYVSADSRPLKFSLAPDEYQIEIEYGSEKPLLVPLTVEPGGEPIRISIAIPQ